MDLKIYYRKLREIEREIAGEFVVVKSLPTPDGGVAGRLTEVARATAARMILEGAAEPSSAEEGEAFRRKTVEEQKQEEQRREAAKIQLAVVTGAELRALQKGGRRSGKD